MPELFTSMNRFGDRLSRSAIPKKFSSMLKIFHSTESISLIVPKIFKPLREFFRSNDQIVSFTFFLIINVVRCQPQSFRGNISI